MSKAPTIQTPWKHTVPLQLSTPAPLQPLMPVTLQLPIQKKERLSALAASLAAVAAVGSVIAGFMQYQATIDAVNIANRNNAIQQYLTAIDRTCSTIPLSFTVYATEGKVAVNRDTIPDIQGVRWVGEEEQTAYSALLTARVILSVWIQEEKKSVYDATTKLVNVVLTPRPFYEKEIWAHQVAGAKYFCMSFTENFAKWFRGEMPPRLQGPEIMMLGDAAFSRYVQEEQEKLVLPPMVEGPEGAPT